MRTSNELFELVNALNTNEKRYFKLHASKYASGNRKYLDLFEAVNKQVQKGSYDEAALLRQFKHEPFTRQMHVAKNYLVKLINRSLLAFHAELKVDFRIYEQLRIADILMHKGLMKQAAKALRKGRRLAEENHEYALLAKVLEREERMSTRQLQFGKAAELIEAQRLEHQKCLNLLDNKEFGVVLYDYYMRVTESRSEQSEEDFRKLIDFKALDDEAGAESVRARIYKYTARTLYENFLGNAEQQVSYQHRIIAMYEETPNLIQQDPRPYLVALHNLNQGLFGLNDFERVIEVNQKIRQTLKDYKVSRRPNVESESLQGVAEFELWVKINLCLAADTIRESLANSIEIYERFHPRMHQQDRINLLYSIAYAWFYIGEFKECQQWLNTLLNQRYDDVRQDLQSLARVLNLILHFELANQQLLDYLEKSAYRFLNSRKRLYKIESFILAFIRRQARAKSKEQRRKALQALQDECLAVADHPFEGKFLEYFDILAWTQAHLDNSSFSEAKRNRLGQSHQK